MREALQPGAERIMRAVDTNGLPDPNRPHVLQMVERELERAYRAGVTDGAQIVRNRELPDLVTRLEAQRLELAQLRGLTPRAAV